MSMSRAVPARFVGGRMTALAALSAAAVISGCSSVTQGTDQTVTIRTVPSGAECRIERDGRTVKTVPSTPAGVVIGRSNNNATVICRKQGYRKAARSLTSGFEEWTLGNGVTLGFGVMFDSASGASNEYPSEVKLVLKPKEHGEPRAKREYFSARAEAIRHRARSRIERVKRACEDGDVPDGKCGRFVERIRSRRDERLRALRWERRRTSVDPQPM